MFSKTSDRMHDIARSGSHSTKPYGSGRVEVLPPEAAPWATIHNSLTEQRDALILMRNSVCEKITQINKKVLSGAPPDELRRLKASRDALVEQSNRLAAEITDLRDDAARMHAATLGECFMMVAKRMLTDEQYTNVLLSAKGAQAEAASLDFVNDVDAMPGVNEEARRQHNRENRAVRDRLAKTDPSSNRGARLLKREKAFFERQSTPVTPMSYVDHLRLRLKT